MLDGGCFSSCIGYVTLNDRMTVNDERIENDVEGNTCGIC
jgi:hypothetical protein